MRFDSRFLLFLQRALLALVLVAPLTAQTGCGDEAAPDPKGSDSDDATDDDEPSDDDDSPPAKVDAGKGAKDSGTAKPGADASKTDTSKDPVTGVEDAGKTDTSKPDASVADASKADAGKSDGSVPDGVGDKPGDGSFPRANAVSVAAKGPYTVKSYTEGLTDKELDSALAYYPDNGPSPFAAIALSPGFTETKEQFTWWGELLASHGFYVLLTTPNNTLTDPPEARGVDLQAALEMIKKENAREGSPVKGKIATDRLAVTGHSMGGGGTLFAANTLGDKIRCAVALQPWQPGGNFAKVTAPTLFLAAQSDTIAPVDQHAYPHYQSVPASVEKVYAEIAGADHFIATNMGGSHDVEARYAVAFYKLHLEDDERYATYLYGAEHTMKVFSRYEKTKK